MLFRGAPKDPKGPSRTVFSTESDSAVNLLLCSEITAHSDSPPTKTEQITTQNVVIHYILSSESLHVVVHSLQIVNSLRVPFLVCRGAPNDV